MQAEEKTCMRDISPHSSGQRQLLSIDRTGRGTTAWFAWGGICMHTD